MNEALSVIDWSILAAYLLAMIGIGALASTRIKGFKDYFLAGGALTTPLLICTLVSTYYGLDVTFGTSESGFYYGLSAWVWYSCPYYVFILIATLVLSRRLKRYDFMTLPDLLGARYGQGTRVVGAIACFIYSAPILQMAGMMTLLKVLGLPVGASLMVTVVVCAVYTMMGGLWADAISDTAQFVLMCVSLAVVIPLAVRWVGGFGFLEHLPAEYTQPHGGRSGWVLAAWAAGGVTVLVEPAFYQRIFAAKDQKSITRALLLGIALWVAYDWGVVVIGMIARAAVEMKLEGVDGDMEGKAALLTVCTHLLPTGLRGLFIGGILASAMSTIDTYSLLASGNLVYDIYRPLSRRTLSDRAMIRLTRGGVFVVMIAAALGSLLFDRLRDAWLFMASVLSSVTLVPVLAALYLKPRRAAGMWGATAGLVGLIVYYTIVIGWGEYDGEEESYVLRLGDVQMWRDAAALFAIPVSAIGFVLGNALGRREVDDV